MTFIDNVPVVRKPKPYDPWKITKSRYFYAAKLSVFN